MSTIAKILSVVRKRRAYDGQPFYITTALMSEGDTTYTAATTKKDVYKVGQEVQTFHNDHYNTL